MSAIRTARSLGVAMAYRAATRAARSIWSKWPLGKKRRATADVYRSLWAAAREVPNPDIDALETQTGYAIDRKWIDDVALRTQIVVKNSRLNYAHGRLLYSVLRERIARLEPNVHVNIVETGSARGFSALCMAKALADSGTSGTVLTFDIVPHDVKMFWNCIADEAGPQTRSSLLAPFGDLANRILFFQGDSLVDLSRFGLPRVPFAFLDGMHTERYVATETAFVEARQVSGDVIVFDDYSPAHYSGVVTAVERLKETYAMQVLAGIDGRNYVVARKR